MEDVNLFGPYFFSGTVNGLAYVQMLLHFHLQ